MQEKTKEKGEQVMIERQEKLPQEQLEQAIRQPLPNEQLFQARLKANDYVVNYLRSLLFLSAGALLVTMIFLKEVLGVNAEFTLLQFLVPTAWILFALCIMFCVLGFGRITYNLDKPDMNTGRSGLPKAFLAGSETMVPAARGAIWTFVLATAAIVTFSSVNYPLFFKDSYSPKTPTAICAEATTAMVANATSGMD